LSIFAKNIGMKRFFLYLTIVAGLCCAIVLWHIREQKAWSEWRLRSLYAVDLMNEKRKAGYSKAEVLEYGEKVTDSLGITTPTPCPYCFMRNIVKYGK